MIIPKFSSSQHFIISHGSLYGLGSAEWFLLKVSHVVSVRYFFRPQSSEGSHGIDVQNGAFIR